MKIRRAAVHCRVDCCVAVAAASMNRPLIGNPVECWFEGCALHPRQSSLTHRAWVLLEPTQAVFCFLHHSSLAKRTDFVLGAEWREGEVLTIEGPRLTCKIPGVGVVGPFHRGLDRNSLWRPVARGRTGRTQAEACDERSATSAPALSPSSLIDARS